MDCLPDNTVARFTTKLNGIIELEGDWEVGLTGDILSFRHSKRVGWTLLLHHPRRGSVFLQNNARCETLRIDSRPRSRNEWEAANVDR